MSIKPRPPDSPAPPNDAGAENGDQGVFIMIARRVVKGVRLAREMKKSFAAARACRAVLDGRWGKALLHWVTAPPKSLRRKSSARQIRMLRSHLAAESS